MLQGLSKVMPLPVRQKPPYVVPAMARTATAGTELPETGRPR
jgi:hypothetical protein